MRIVAVLCGVVGAAAFAAAVVVGRGAIEPKPLDPAQVRLDELSWAERASSECSEFAGQIRAVLAGAPGLEGAETRAVRLYDETTQIERALVMSLRELPARPAAADEAIAIFARRNARDVETASALRRSYDPELLERELTSYERTAAELRGRFDALGAPGCVAYLDPESYD